MKNPIKQFSRHASYKRFHVLNNKKIYSELYCEKEISKRPNIKDSDDLTQKKLFVFGPLES